MRHGASQQSGHFHDADLRYKVWDMHEQRQANAAVYMLMDVSGSMTTSKKYIAKSFFFWMVRFLQLKYQKVEMVFIAHDTEAQVVPEQDFFALSQGGGTRCSSAYQLALAHLQQHHPGDRWNTYLFHFSDGDNLPDDNAVCKALVETLLLHCSMVGYGEIRYRDDASFYGWIGQTSLRAQLAAICPARHHASALAECDHHPQGRTLSGVADLSATAGDGPCLRARVAELETLARDARAWTFFRSPLKWCRKTL